MAHDKKPVTVLTISGFDPSGGAGIQADLKTIHALGGYALTAITAVTVQNTMGVQAVFPLQANLVWEQITCLLADIEIQVIKIGMLGSLDIVKKLIPLLQKVTIPIVLDPVFMSTCGRYLLPPSALEALKRNVFPLCTLITPNLDEVGALLGANPCSPKEREASGRALLKFGCQAVLIKGGHSATDGPECLDCLVSQTADGDIQINWFAGPRRNTANTHGTGCTLASAIATLLGKSYPLSYAVQEAKEFMDQALITGADIRLGKGKGPVLACIPNRWGGRRLTPNPTQKPPRG